MRGGDRQRQSLLNFLRKGNVRGTLRGAGGHIGHKAEVGRESKRSGAGIVFFGFQKICDGRQLVSACGGSKSVG